MIDINNYKRAIQWLRRGLTQLEREPENPAFQLSVLQSFEVTYNLSESLLRQAHVALSDNKDAAYLSTRELLRQAGEDGLVLSSPRQWLHYGLVLESMREACMFALEANVEQPSQLVSRFAQDLESFAMNLEKRLAANA